MEIMTAAIAIAGPLDRQRRHLVAAPHLPDWIAKPLGSDIARICNCQQVLLQNDAAMVGLGEATSGAGKDGNIVAYITISTGVGGAKIVNKKIESTVFGFEPGHQLLLIPHVGTEPTSWEKLVSGSGIMERYGHQPDEITDGQIWQEITHFVAVGLHNVIIHWSPDTVVLGGGIIESGKISVTRLFHEVEKLLKIFPDIPVIKKSELGDLAGLYGCLYMLQGRSSENYQLS
jgi:glucokinase